MFYEKKKVSELIFQTSPKVFSNAKPYEAPKQTPVTPAFTSGYNPVHTGKLLIQIIIIFIL